MKMMAWLFDLSAERPGPLGIGAGYGTLNENVKGFARSSPTLVSEICSKVGPDLGRKLQSASGKT
ncbi:hypothetical protein SCP_0601470 [Sparassis crispa]|uniref:Uncharacterized protein n=1 Tax=Sparassis crispa TaxID=139825 RepID=A0A401GPT8_9APHY|nr:hypothetical protein SCP_0601470 [Sparassis crispa]GBE84169.1 hypothetical protein SCP_0601470 [Sparassis crispa]